MDLPLQIWKMACLCKDLKCKELTKSLVRTNLPTLFKFSYQQYLPAESNGPSP